MGTERELKRGVGAPLKVHVHHLTKRSYERVENKERGERQQAVFELRRMTGMSREELAEWMGVTSNSIWAWESGRAEVSRLAWGAFCRVRAAYRKKLRKQCKELDGGPVMEA